VNFNEPNSALAKAALKYADESVLTYVPQYVVDAAQERADRKTVRLMLEGDDPAAMAGIDPKRIITEQKAVSEVLSPIRKSAPQAQWNIIYAPTTMSIQRTYADIPDKWDALKQAAVDAKSINRVGNVEANSVNLKAIADKVNSFDFKEINLYSVDPKTGEKDGKSDITIGMSEKSTFIAAAKASDDGVLYMANVPTEEVFTSPDKNKVNGWISSTLPLVLNGNIVDGIRMRFEDGVAVEVYADQNQELWREHVNSTEGANMLGELALVANSPIYDTGRVFYSTLLDENAVCHIAIGTGFSDCVAGASDIKCMEERQEYMKKHNINDSNIHTDFMVGGPNVVVEGIQADGTRVLLIKNNEYQMMG
jgi:aminopeptidase